MGKIEKTEEKRNLDDMTRSLDPKKNASRIDVLRKRRQQLVTKPRNTEIDGVEID